MVLIGLSIILKRRDFLIAIEAGYKVSYSSNCHHLHVESSHDTRREKKII